jgi:uncharacterized protein YjcR
LAIGGLGSLCEQRHSWAESGVREHSRFGTRRAGRAVRKRQRGNAPKEAGKARGEAGGKDPLGLVKYRL